MKTTTACKILAITIACIFIIGPTAAATGVPTTGKSGILSGYKGSFTNLSTNTKPDWAKFDPYQKDLWKALPATGPYCSTCAVKNATKTWNSVMSEKYNTDFIKKYKTSSGIFAGGAGGGAGAGGGCCGG